MSKSLNAAVIHLVFVTKRRKPFILPNIHSQFHEYIKTTCNNLGFTVIRTGGYYEHIHLLCRLSEKVTIMKLTETLKSQSSRWVKHKAPFLQEFQWQPGYYLSSIRESEINKVKKYIDEQEVHHSTMKFTSSDQIFIAKNKNVPIKPWLGLEEEQQKATEYFANLRAKKNENTEPQNPHSPNPLCSAG